MAVLQCLLVFSGEDAGAAPMKVPRVSNVSDMEKAKMVTMTSGSLVGSENSAGKPSAEKIAPKVCGSWEKVSLMDCELDQVVTPNGMPITVVMAMASSMPPLTFITVNTMASTRPIRKTHSTLSLKSARPGVAATAPPLAAAFGSPGVNLIRPTFSMPT